MAYKPRRATAHWLVGAPPYVFDCFDHKKGLERYTILPELSEKPRLFRAGMDSSEGEAFLALNS